MGQATSKNIFVQLPCFLSEALVAKLDPLLLTTRTSKSSPQACLWRRRDQLSGCRSVGSYLAARRRVHQRSARKFLITVFASSQHPGCKWLILLMRKLVALTCQLTHTPLTRPMMMTLFTFLKSYIQGFFRKPVSFTSPDYHWSRLLGA